MYVCMCVCVCVCVFSQVCVYVSMWSNGYIAIGRFVNTCVCLGL